MKFSVVLSLSIFFFVIHMRYSVAQIELLGGSPLLKGATSFTFTITTSTITKPTPCFITSGVVSQCRRKRGLEERPEIVKFDDLIVKPSSVIGIEATPVPLVQYPRDKAGRILSSFGDDYHNSLNIFRELMVRGRNNVISVGDCGKSTVNFSQFLSCLGLTIQETTTLTATFTETATVSTGFTTMTVGGCTPLGFPYIYCPIDATITTTASTTLTTPSINSNTFSTLPSTTVFTTTFSTSTASTATTPTTTASTTTTPTTTASTTTTPTTTASTTTTPTTTASTTTTPTTTASTTTTSSTTASTTISSSTTTSTTTKPTTTDMTTTKPTTPDMTTTITPTTTSTTYTKPPTTTKRGVPCEKYPLYTEKPYNLFGTSISYVATKRPPIPC